MPVDQQALKDSIREAVGDDNELYALLEQKLLANDSTATRFLGGFMRNKDYTTKTQGLASERQTMADEKKMLDGQIQQYRQLLEAAEADKAKVMKDLAQQNINVATANARLKTIKSTYQLSDADIPDIPDQIETFQKGKVVDHSVDIDEKLNAFEKKITDYLTSRLIPELGGMARLPGIFDDVREEHRELTGKKLTYKEHEELLKEAERRAASGKTFSYRQLWEEKYDVAGLRQKVHDEALEKKLREKWDTEQKAKISEAAMQGIRPDLAQQQGLRTSSILDHKFKVHEDTEPATASKLREMPSSNDRQRLTGAERAAKVWMERRGQGIPMGAPVEKKGNVA